MKRTATLFILVLLSISLPAQILKPASWQVETSATSASVGDEVDVIFTATIDGDWYLYSSDFDPNCGPMVTTFDFEGSRNVELVGEIRPIKPKKKFDDIFGCDVTYFEGTGRFVQTLKITGPEALIKGTYEYQVCTDVDGRCIPFDDEFVLVVGTKGREEETKGRGDEGTKGREEVAKGRGDEGTKGREEVTKGRGDEGTKGREEETKGRGDEGTRGREEETKGRGDEGTRGRNDATTASTKQSTNEDGVPIVELTQFFDGEYGIDKVSYTWFMLLAFLAGLAAILTPCVFPMIPMTVAFFSNQQGGYSKALFYGFSIVLIYTIIGAVISPFMGPETANHLATEWLPNLIFSLVFFVFALSFFGLFDINMPSWLVNSADKQADKGGYVGVFFMALTLALVSFSCTGPIVATILVESAGGYSLKPILGMAAFAMAFAIPFTLFAIFPGALSKLPQSGGWLNSVKVVLGFIELALALKFISIADQAFHWNLIDREVNIAFWIVIASMIGFYLLGKIKMPGDSDLKHVGVGRLLLAIISFSFVVYLIPGMFGAPLKALAGYLPPMHTLDFNIEEIVRANSSNQDDSYLALCEEPKYEEFLHLPHGLQGYFDYDQAIRCAREQNKPLFIDFTGHGCVNCREMEAAVWKDPRVLKRLRNDFVIVALYVDDKTELPQADWYVSAYDNKVKRTIGKQNADIQIQRAGRNAQPNYFILDHQEKALTEPVAYSDVDEFINFLDQGYSNFQKQLLASE